MDETQPELRIDFYKHLFSQIKRIMSDTFRATYKVIDPHRRHHSFEIYGYDFMFDENFKVYLIEVNTNPCLETTSPILQRIITNVVDSGLRIAVDPLFPPPNYHKRMNLSIPITPWELIFDSQIDGPELDRIFQKHECANNQKNEPNMEEIFGGGDTEDCIQFD